MWEQCIVLHMLGGIIAQSNVHLPVTRKLLDTNGEYEVWEWPVLWEGRQVCCDMYLTEWCLCSMKSVEERWFLVLVFLVMECLLKILHFFYLCLWFSMDEELIFHFEQKLNFDYTRVSDKQMCLYKKGGNYVTYSTGTTQSLTVVVDLWL